MAVEGREYSLGPLDTIVIPRGLAHAAWNNSASGRAVVQRIQSDGQVKRLRTMLPGAIVGDVAYSLQGLRSADVTAETETTTLSISRTHVQRLARTKPELAFLFNALLNRALAEKVLTANRMTEHAG